MKASSVNPCLLVAIYNHGDTIGAVIEALAPLGFPCLVVDDGSDEATREILDRLDSDCPWVRLERRTRNGGRGAALKTGYRLAARLGYTHAVQIDADGQHSTSDVPVLLDAARRCPDALILGYPIFGANAPRSRRYGHWISQSWIWLETCSFAIRDPLCGLRCMPLAPTVRVIERARCGDHMEFDPEIAVRLVWEGVPVINVPIRIRYLPGGISHFGLFRDNVRISWLHTRLFFGMLTRVPRLVARRFGYGS
jgi:glycosyltransferase involved in cell wall biosynthesis